MDFTLEQLTEALRKLSGSTTDIIEFFYGADHNQTVVGKIRYMNTAGGMQFGFRVVTQRGEGSGMYFPLEEIDLLSNMVVRHFERQASTGYHPVNQLFEVRFRFARDYVTPCPFDVLFDNIPGLEGAETITLTLPEKKQ